MNFLSKWLDRINEVHSIPGDDENSTSLQEYLTLKSEANADPNNLRSDADEASVYRLVFDLMMELPEYLINPNERSWYSIIFSNNFT